jgi:hypothetical protein
MSKLPGFTADLSLLNISSHGDSPHGAEWVLVGRQILVPQQWFPRYIQRLPLPPPPPFSTWLTWQTGPGRPPAEAPCDPATSVCKCTGTTSGSPNTASCNDMVACCHDGHIVCLGTECTCTWSGTHSSRCI